MHLIIINGSPRVQKLSNTDKIIAAFVRGYCEGGNSYELYSLSDRTQWEPARTAFSQNTEILFATPLYAENIPGMLLEFLETLPVKQEAGASIAFLLQGGFAEGCQLRCGESFLEKLPSFFNCSYCGTLAKGDNFGIRVADGEEREKIVKPYENMGRLFARKMSFCDDEAKAFTGAERLSFFSRLILSIVFKTVAPKRYYAVAKEWGCTRPLNAKPYQLP